jgi:hypothetical protein
VFLKSTLLPIQLPDNPADEVFFFTSVAFLAGFSERFAQDVFLRSGRAVGDEDGAPAATAPVPAAASSTRDIGAAIRTLAGSPSSNGHAAPASSSSDARSAAQGAATETATGIMDDPG